MKGVLSDRFLLASITVLVIGSLIFGYFIYEDSGIGLAFGQPLTDRQKSRAISIAMADPFVMNEAGPYANSIRGALHVKDVLAFLPFHEVGPDMDRMRSLPAVEIIAGNESELGTNIFAFVDLGQSRVVHVGYTQRVDASGRLPPDGYRNMSLVETGYHAGDILTGEQRDKTVRIAMENTTVQEKMRGMHNNTQYRVNGNITVSHICFFKDNGLYIGAYPIIQFREEASIYVPSLTVYVTVDPDRGKVLESMAVINTPALDGPGNTS